MQGKSVVRTSSIPSNPESPHRCQDCGPVSGTSRISSAWNPVKKKRGFTKVILDRETFELFMHMVPATQGIVSGMSDDGMFA